jgi:anti-sigma factor RsiW
MSQPPPNHDAAHYEALLMKSVDGLLSPDEKAELDAHLASHPELAAELDDFNQIKETTDAMTTRILQDADIEPPRASASTKAVLTTSFLLMLAGSLLLLGFAGYEFAIDSSVPPLVKWGAALAGAGLLVAFAYTLRIRMRAIGRDPYEEIDQ